MKTMTDPRPILTAALKKAVKPYSAKLKEFFDGVPHHNEQINRYSAARAEEDWYSLHGRAAQGDKEAQEEIKAMPAPDFRSFRQKYATLENMYWEAFQNWHKTFDPTIAAAAKAALAEADKVAEETQRQLDAVHTFIGEPCTPSAFVAGEINNVRNLCRFILDDRAEKDPTFLKDYI